MTALRASLTRSLAPFALLALLIAGCRGGSDKPGYMVISGMDEPVPYETYDPNKLLPGGQTLQPPPMGTVASHQTPMRYAKGPKEALRAGRELTNPLKPTEKNMARAKHLFDTFCVVCHGDKGMGDGPIIGRFPNPPNLHAKHAINLKDGNIFHLITHGQGLMNNYRVQVRPMDRWRLVHYVRDLQRAVAAADKAQAKKAGKKAAAPAAPAKAGPLDGSAAQAPAPATVEPQPAAPEGAAPAAAPADPAPAATEGAAPAAAPADPSPAAKDEENKAGESPPNPAAAPAAPAVKKETP